MKKIIRLTESDLNRLVKRIITEQNDEDDDEKIKNIINRVKGGGEFGTKNPEFKWLLSKFEKDRTGKFKDAINQIISIKRGGRLSQNGGELPTRNRNLNTSGYENNGQTVLLRNESADVVSDYLSNIDRNTRFVAIINCEYADFSDIDVCGNNEFVFINLTGTDNNFEEQGYNCAEQISDGLYQITNESK